jgi:hypothetical protein
LLALEIPPRDVESGGGDSRDAAYPYRAVVRQACHEWRPSVSWNQKTCLASFCRRFSPSSSTPPLVAHQSFEFFYDPDEWARLFPHTL